MHLSMCTCTPEQWEIRTAQSKIWMKTLIVDQHLAESAANQNSLECSTLDVYNEQVVRDKASLVSYHLYEMQ